MRFSGFSPRWKNIGASLLKTCTEVLADKNKYTQWNLFFHVYPRCKICSYMIQRDDLDRTFLATTSVDSKFPSAWRPRLVISLSSLSQLVAEVSSLEKMRARASVKFSPLSEETSLENFHPPRLLRPTSVVRKANIFSSDQWNIVPDQGLETLDHF